MYHLKSVGIYSTDVMCQVLCLLGVGVEFAILSQFTEPLVPQSIFYSNPKPKEIPSNSTYIK